MSNDDNPSGPEYEDFEPRFEWQGDNKNKLLIYLPGFLAVHLDIKKTAPFTLTVSGKCKVDNDKWKRFKREFTTPRDDFTMNEINPCFKDEIYTITMPATVQTKKHINQLHNQMQNKEEKPALAHHQKPLPKLTQKPHIESYEAKQLVVNVVAAGLVILALGAYILFTN